MTNRENHRGSEIHRLKPMQESYDVNLFNKLYKLCKPVIRNLVRQIDHRRFNLTPDIIHSYFVDKLLYVFQRYYGTCSEDHLQAKILLSLSTYKNKLLRSAYSEEAETNLEMRQLEDLFDNDKELEDDSEENKLREEKFQLVEAYMKKHLDLDAQLVFGVMMNPPEFLKKYPGNGKGKFSAVSLVKFFNMPQNRASVRYINELKDDIEYWISKAHEELR